MRCSYCGGIMVFYAICPQAGQFVDEWRCLYCGRTNDIRHEVDVKRIQNNVNESGLVFGPLFKGKGHKENYQRLMKKKGKPNAKSKRRTQSRGH